MIDSRQAETAPPQRISPTPDAPALTRAELRRRAQLETAKSASAPPERRRSRERAPSEEALPAVAVEDLPDLAPEALELPDLPAEVPLVVETAAAAVDASPTRVPTAPISLPSRRSRVRPIRVEPDAAPQPADEATAAGDVDAGASEPGVDEFEAAARLFSFTGETPVQVAAAALAEEEAPASPRPTQGSSFRRVAAASFSVGVIGVVGLLTVGMTTPVEAVAAAQGGTAAVSVLAPGDVAPDESEIQAYVAPAQVENQAVTRTDDYKVTSIAEIAAESGISNFSNLFVNNPNSPIQWPFAVGVPMSYGFGMRSGTMHQGIDFTPGAGAPVQAIADGTVRIATESGGAYGVMVIIDHVIDGELVSSRYGHMQYGSLQVVTGQQVKVGTFIGRTGNTGRSFGAHTHFEILAGGTTAIDPLPWLRSHAGG
ncbi:M23 family metallopeptidase [Microbacterium sp. RD1]|uniref:M23 family metallopeptidase n=1 Tax=Microbacterium sp. RD1 TaxID=3457313 RepID=UPI003FA567F2